MLTTAPRCVTAENWPAWRGPRGNGVSAERDLPTTWSDTKNVRWKVALPEAGNSTPVIWGDHVFLTQALDGGKRRALMAMHRADGKKLWQQEVACPVTETTHRQNPPCSASAVTDGAAVYAHFASAGVVAYDFQGKQHGRTGWYCNASRMPTALKAPVRAASSGGEGGRGPSRQASVDSSRGWR